MKKSFILFCCIASGLIFCAVTSGFAQTVEENLKSSFPKLKFEAVNPTPITGLYEVVSGTNIAYFAPATGNLIFGEMIDKNGRNVTTDRVNTIVVAKAKTLPLDKAVVVGKGNSTVIEFTDPDCPYCRSASSFLAGKTDVKRFIFFIPLPMHKDAERKVRYVFCSADREKAYEDAMKGKLDDEKYEVCKKTDVDELVALHKELAGKMGVTGTPFFVVNGQVIPGADMARIEAALAQK
jgi:thiol:disulfide interchange protein DsbC